jgi:crotonobetainyl-CoA:carnitine CoA-transferase CaiB-like acyl-CoA transferase
VTFIPHYGLFECADGSWLSLGIVHEDHFWQRLCDAARLDDLAAMDFDERLAEAGRIEAMLSATFVTRTAAEWERELLEADVPVAVVAEISEIFDSPQFRARAMFGAEGGQRFLAQPARLSGARVASTETAPRRGEHADAVLSELGYTAAQVEALRRDGVLGEA